MPVRGLPDLYFRDNYNSPLDPVTEDAFNQYLRTESLRRGYDMNLEMNDYDLRGAFGSGQLSGGFGQHGTDQYKKPNHPTFSDESMYHHTPSPFGEPWMGGHWTDHTYTPSAEMLDHNDIDALKSYMRDKEPDIKLIVPKRKKNAK